MQGKVFASTVAVVGALAAFAAKGQGFTENVRVVPGEPVAINFHFQLDGTCREISIPEAVFLGQPRQGKVWTEVAPYEVRNEDLTYGAGDCAGRVINAMFVCFQANENASGPDIVLYRRVAGDEGDALWRLDVDIASGFDARADTPALEVAGEACRNGRIHTSAPRNTG